MRYYILGEGDKDDHNKKTRKTLKQWENEMSGKIELKKKKRKKKYEGKEKLVIIKGDS